MAKSDNKGNGWGKGKNGPKGLGKAGKGASCYGQNQLKGRYSRKRINSEYGGGK